MVDAGAPVFVLALHPRSGTNFLSDLLSAHPLVDRSPVPEDFIAERAGILSEYAENLVGKWEKYFDRGRLKREDYTADRLLCQFGQSLLAFIGQPNSERHMLLKTPALLDLPTLQRLFPTGQMLILLRDPRSIAESWLQSNFEDGASVESVGYRCAQNMRALERWLNSGNKMADRERLHFVRFEELARSPCSEYQKILERIGLPYNAEAVAYAEDPPIIGSSFGNQDHKRRHRSSTPTFAPRRRPQGFDPTCRWAHWSIHTHRRFNRVCGSIMARWGYAPITEQSHIIPE